MFQKQWMIRNHRKISLIWSIACLLLCCAMLVGSTYAWFTQAVTSSANRIQSGGLKVGLIYKSKVFRQNEAGSTPWSNWTDASDSEDILNKNALYEPGDLSLTFFKIENQGNLSFKYQLALLKKAETAGRNVLGDSFRISDYLTFHFVRLTDQTAITREDVEKDRVGNFTREKAFALLDRKNSGKGTGFPYTIENVMGTDEQETHHIVALVITMPADVGAVAMYDATAENACPQLTLDFRLGATQYTGEKDAFDKQYDDKAVYNELDHWNAARRATGILPLVCYENDNDQMSGRKSVSVTRNGDTDSYALIVSECNAPDGITVTSDEICRSYNIMLLDASGEPVSGEKEYTVTIFAARYLSKVRLYHNGQPTSVDNSITFNDEDYHPDTGYLTFRTKGFSVFTVVGEEAAVRIGENKMYSSVESALQAVHKGTADKTATLIVMKKEIEIKSPLVIQKNENITLDLNGCTVRTDISNTITNEGAFTLQDTAFNYGKISVSGQKADGQSCFINNKGSLTLTRGAVAINITATDAVGFAGVSSLNGTVNVQGGELNVNVDRTTGKTYVEAMLVNGGSLKMSSGWISAKTTTGPVSSIYLYGVQSEVTGGLLNVSAVEGDCYGMTLVNTPSGHIAGVQVTAEAQNGDAYGMHMSKTGNLTLDQFHIKVKSDNGKAYGIYNDNGAGCLDIGTKKDAVSIIAVEGKLAVYGVDYYCVAGTYRHQHMKIVCSSYEDIATGLSENGMATTSEASVFIQDVTVQVNSPLQNQKYQKGIVFSGNASNQLMKADVKDVTIVSPNVSSVGFDFGTVRSQLHIGDNVKVDVNYLGLFAHGNNTVVVDGKNVVIHANADHARADEGACGIWQNAGILRVTGVEISGGAYGADIKGGKLEAKNCKIVADTVSKPANGVVTEGTGQAELEGCRIEAKSTGNVAKGIWCNGSNNITIKTDNTVQAVAKEGQKAYAILKADSSSGSVIDSNSHQIADVLSTTTCTWTGVS